MKAAKHVLLRLITGFGRLRGLITGKLRCDIKPTRDLAPDAERGAHKGLNNAIEVSHRPGWKGKRVMSCISNQPDTYEGFLVRMAR